MGIIILLGWITILVGAILFLVAAFKVSLVWGILCLLLSPASLIFLIIHWKKAWKPWCIQLIGIAVLALGVAMTPGISVRQILQIASSEVLPGNYDLTGTIKGHTPDPVFVGDAVTFTYGISNNGKDKVPSGSYMVKFYVNDNCVGYDGLTSAITAGSGHTYSMAKGYNHFVAERPGEYKYKLEITPRQGLVDANPGNNIITGTIMVRESSTH